MYFQKKTNPITLAAADAIGETPTSVSPTENPTPSMLVSSNDKSPQRKIWRYPPQHPQYHQQHQQQVQNQQVVENCEVLDLPMSGETFSRSAKDHPMPLISGSRRCTSPIPATGSPCMPWSRLLAASTITTAANMRAVEQLQQQTLQQQTQQQ